jgi:hypothetical protein
MRWAFLRPPGWTCGPRNGPQRADVDRSGIGWRWPCNRPRIGGGSHRPASLPPSLHPSALPPLARDPNRNRSSFWTPTRAGASMRWALPEPATAGHRSRVLTRRAISCLINYFLINQQTSYRRPPARLRVLGWWLVLTVHFLGHAGGPPHMARREGGMDGWHHFCTIPT